MSELRGAPEEAVSGQEIEHSDIASSVEEMLDSTGLTPEELSTDSDAASDQIIASLDKVDPSNEKAGSILRKLTGSRAVKLFAGAAAAWAIGHAIHAGVEKSAQDSQLASEKQAKIERILSEKLTTDTKLSENKKEIVANWVDKHPEVQRLHLVNLDSNYQEKRDFTSADAEAGMWITIKGKNYAIRGYGDVSRHAAFSSPSFVPDSLAKMTHPEFAPIAEEKALANALETFQDQIEQQHKMREFLYEDYKQQRTQGYSREDIRDRRYKEGEVHELVHWTGEDLSEFEHRFNTENKTSNQ